MKKKAGKSFVTIISCLLVIALAANFAPNLRVSTVTSAASLGSGLTDVTDKYSIDELRESQFDPSVVQKNTVKKDDSRWVIVTLSDEGVIDEWEKSGYGGDYSEYSASYLGRRSAAEMREDHVKLLAALDKRGIDYEFKYSYTSLLNAVAVKVKMSDVAAIRKIKGVEDVWYSERYAEPEMVAVSNDANVYKTGIYDTSDITEYQGENMVVAILDTGLDYTHEAFSTEPNNPRFNQAYIEEKLPNLLAKTERDTDIEAKDVYYNSKVPYVFDYADDDPDVYPSYSTHGTHVAGIVAGKDESKHVNPDDYSEIFVGVAPMAQLAIMKVFTDDLDSRALGGADTVDILAAVNDCVELGVDVINMSLGSAGGFSDYESDQAVSDTYNKVKVAGVSLVVAAGNEYSSGFGGGYGTNLASNPDSGTVGSPSTYDGALSVASINGKLSPYVMGKDGTVAFINNAADEFGNDIEFVDGIMAAAASTANGKQAILPDSDGVLTLKYVLVGGVGNTINYSGSVRRALEDGNTIALVRRGDITFEDKVNNAMAAGAMGVIVYNNLSGTIRMSLGEVEDPVPTCSIGMDAGERLAAAVDASGVGRIQISKSYEAGPFMSEFSSWGPTPDLRLKPEITAHGGEITSAVPGGYDEYSGTSMAAPNMAGAVAILRQYAEEKFGLEGPALSARVNQLLMSTATMARNEENNPYSPRKQGAGLARIREAIETKAYITTEANGAVMDKTKLELGDDKERKGVYEMDFTVNNFSDSAIIYRPRAYVMTETLAVDLRTVAEKAYMLTDTKVEITAGGVNVAEGGSVQVPAASGDNYGTLKIHVKLTLGEQGRAYIEQSFKNGMYVEGFIRLEAESSGAVELGVPFLAFYGDWMAGPLFDYDMYEVSVEEVDSSIEERDKIKAQSSASRPLGLYHNDEYIIPLGAYLYEMADEDTEIAASDDRAAISMYDITQMLEQDLWDETVDEDNFRSAVYELYMVYAGLIRCAKELDITVKDAATGEIVFKKTEYNVRKAYAGGGGNYGSPVMCEINPYQWGMKNNSTYVVTLKGRLDGPGDEVVEAERDEFSFKFSIDYEAPTIRDYRVRYEPYTENKETKYRIYLDVDVYDNQYAMSVMPCYSRPDRSMGYDDKGNPLEVLTMLTEHPVPVYSSQKGQTTTVSFEVTDYYDEYVKTGKLFISVEDYALNHTTFNVGPIAATDLPETVTLATDNKLVSRGAAENGVERYELTIAPNEIYKFTMNSLPEGTVGQKLEWAVSDDCVIMRENRVAAMSEGTSIALLQAAAHTDFAGHEVPARTLCEVTIRVQGTPLKPPVLERLTLKPVLNGDGHLIDINTVGRVEMNPNMTFEIVPDVEPWYAADMLGLSFTISSDNERVASAVKDEDGRLMVTTHVKGTAGIRIEVEGDYHMSKRITVRVGDDYYINNYTLYDYYGGPIAHITDDLNVMYLSESCFRYNTTIEEVYLPKTLTEIPEDAFIGCTNLRKIQLNAATAVIREGAFARCTNLETLVLERAEDKNIPDDKTRGALTVGRLAFEGCTALDTIVDDTGSEEGQQRLTTLYDYAFKGCTGLTSIDLTGLRVVGRNVFAGCTSLSNVTTTEHTAIGENMFYGCSALTNVTVNYGAVAAGAYRNSGVTTLTLTDIVSSVGDYAFAGTKIQTLTLPNGNVRLGEGAFGNITTLTTVNIGDNTSFDRTGLGPFVGDTALKTFHVNESNTHFSQDGGILYDKEKHTIELVPAGYDGTLGAFTVPEGVTAIGTGAFAGATGLTSIDFTDTSVDTIGEYAFANSSIQTVTFPESIKFIPAGAFSGCTSLTSVTATGVTEIGNGAFRGASIGEVDFPVLTTIGDNAFRESTITNTKDSIQGVLVMPNVTKIGDNAFRDVKSVLLVTFASTDGISIGNSAFRGMALKGVVFGKVTEMGDYAFADAANLRTAAFGDGTTVIGNYAFANYDEENYAFNENQSLTGVTLPATHTVKTIGDYAFALATNLTSIDLTGVTEIGENAFNNAIRLRDVGSLASVETVGDGAFYFDYALTSVDLTGAKEVGAGAFYAANALNEVKFGALEKLGEAAFYATSLRTVTLPATFDEYLFEDKYSFIDDHGKPDIFEGKYLHSLGSAAFAGIGTLTEILVEEGNETFRSIDGVLYSVQDNGLVLEQYPAGKTGAAYTVAEGTVRIADSAFENAGTVIVRSGSNFVSRPISGEALETVTFPYTVERLGDNAFFHSSARNFVFESVEAPELESYYIDPYTFFNPFVDTQTDAANAALFSAFFQMNALNGDYFPFSHNSDVFYTNFGTHAAIVLERDFIAFFTYQQFGVELDVSYTENGEYLVPDYEYFETLTITYPENGTGYDSPVYNAYFDEEARTLTEYAPTRNTRRAIAGLTALPSAADIRSAYSAAAEGTTDEQKREWILGYAAEVVRPVRDAFDLVTDPRQIEFLGTLGDRLLAAEAEVHAIRTELGIPPEIISLDIVSYPNKTEYVAGETLDLTGMVIRAVFDDNAKLDVTDYTVSVTGPLDETIDSVVITYRDKSATIYITVTPAPPSDEHNGLPVWAIVLIAVGCALAAGAIAATVVLLLRKKKLGGGHGGDNGGDNGGNEDNADGGNEANAEGNAESGSEGSEANAEGNPDPTDEK